MARKKQKRVPTQQEIDEILGRRQKSKVIYEKEINQVDNETGELSSQQRTIVKTTQKEPDFIKLYYGTMCVFQGAEDIPVNFLCEMSNFLTYANANKDQMTVSLGMYHRNIIAKNLGISVESVNRIIKKCVDSQVLFKTGFRGTYIANPFLIARGNWDTIRDLRAAFDYKNGVWAYNEIKNITDDGSVIESKTVSRKVVEEKTSSTTKQIEQIEFTDLDSFDAIVKEMRNATKKSTD